MRLIRLDLERYGAFTDRSVTLRPDARLHVVLGANEAGKSTALAAVGDLLFGFEKFTRYAFRHDTKLLRVGAEIAAADGRRLAFRRRKGNVRTLIDADEAALPDDALAPYLGGITRTVFCRAFGLDAASLRAGGKEMVDVEGEVGASLFAAGSGLRGLTELQSALDGEADGIFGPKKAKHRTFYQALDRYDEAHRAIRDRMLRSSDWKALNEAIEAAAGQLDALDVERRRVASERARLERLKRIRPVVAEIDALEARIAEDPGLVEADIAWIGRLGAALDAGRAAQAEAARTAATLTRACAEAEAVSFDPALTLRADEILACFGGIGNYEKGGTDLPRVQGDADGVGLALDRLRARVGVADVEALDAAQPTEAARLRIERLIREGRSLAATEEQLARERALALAERDRLAQEVQAAGATHDPTPLREALKPFARLHETVAQHERLDAEMHRLAGQLRNEAGRLTPPVADVAALARAPLPSSEAIARFRTLLADKRREAERATDRRDAAARQADKTRGKLRAREAERPIPTQDRLEALRAAREAAFVPLREALAAGAAVAPAVIAAFERAVFDADRLADERAADAARVAAHAADLDRLAAEETEEEAAGRALAEVAAEAEAGEAAWREAWRPSDIDPTPPAEMAAWLAEAQSLIEGGQRLTEDRIERDRLAGRIEAMRGPLGDLCTRAGLDALPGLEVGALLAAVETRVAALAARWEANLETGGLLRAATATAARLDAARAETESHRAAWRAEWVAALAPIGLDGQARPEEAEGALEAWRAVPERLAERAGFLRRAAGIRRDMRGFETSVAGLVGDLAADLVGLPPDSAIRTLHARLVAARAHEARRTELDRHREAAERAAAAAAHDRDVASAALARQIGEAVPALADAPATEIEALHARLTVRAALRGDLARLRGGLARAADGLPEAELRRDLDALPPEAVEAELSRLATEAEAQEERGRHVFAERDRNERLRAEREAGTGAELALAERKAAEADLQTAARSWAVLRIAGMMLGQAVARHRAGQQDPLVSRAGALFRALTGGAFEGLAQTYDEADTPKLAGRRAGGDLVTIEALSEGTRDQLYLALRLAYLEDYAGRAEPAPFIGDDLFITFDDARTAHGLDALAAIGASVQPILFTHHRHVADIARDRLGTVVDIVEL